MFEVLLLGLILSTFLQWIVEPVEVALLLYFSNQDIKEGEDIVFGSIEHK